MQKIFLSFLFVMGLATVSFAQTDSTGKQYVGKYTFPGGSVIADAVVTVENGVLMVATSVGNSVLEKTGTEDTYTVVAFQGTAVFKRDSNKNVNGVVIDAMGYHLEGTKSASIFILNNSKYLEKFKR